MAKLTRDSMYVIYLRGIGSLPPQKNPWMTFKSLPEPNFYKLDRLQCLLLQIPVKRNRMLSLKLQRKVKQLQY